VARPQNADLLEPKTPPFGEAVEDAVASSAVDISKLSARRSDAEQASDLVGEAGAPQTVDHLGA
jgi:hypothetical protein